MMLSARQQLRQLQTLTMTPQLMQSIRLLQLTHAELEQFIDEEVEKNPLLERSDPAPEPDPAISWKSHGDAGSHELSGIGFDIDQLAAPTATFAAHIAEQITFAFRDNSERAIAYELASTLDEAGYLRTTITEIAQRLGSTLEAVLAVLTTCQKFDPPGLFARNLSECLALQLSVRDRLDPAMQAMIGRLDLVAKRDFSQLRQICAVDDDDLIAMIEEIRQLDPRPAAAFTVGVADIVVPDVIVRQAGDGGWAVELNAATLPQVLINQVYFAHVAKYTVKQAEKDFLGQCMQNASWLMRSLDQRARTILKVAKEIVRQQDGFLVHGIQHLRPLILKDIAKAINMHETTISRVTINKYMMTPRGVFEMRHFFSVALAAVEGNETYSSIAVHDHIRELIAAEDPNAVLSDDAIMDSLHRSGIKIARRTIAKYRETMGIPSSIVRRREKHMQAKPRNCPYQIPATDKMTG